ncbi:MAG: hypothetical protein QM695_12645 [Micropruina sp.]
MRRVHLAEFRDSWTAWLGVSLAFVAVNAALVLTVVIGYTGVVAVAEGRLSLETSTSWTIGQALVLGCVLLVALPVVGSSTSLVVGSRRGSLARLALAGATPAQVRGTVTSQLAAVSLLCAPLGDLIAVLAMRPWLALMDYSARDEPSWVSLEPNYALAPIVASNLACVALVVLAGRRQATSASEIPPAGGAPPGPGTEPQGPAGCRPVDPGGVGRRPGRGVVRLGADPAGISLQGDGEQPDGARLLPGVHLGSPAGRRRPRPGRSGDPAVDTAGADPLSCLADRPGNRGGPGRPAVQIGGAGDVHLRHRGRFADRGRTR